MLQDTPVFNMLLDNNPSKRSPKLPLTTPLCLKQNLLRFMMGHPCKELGDLHNHEVLVEARDRARVGGRAGTQTASVSRGGRRTMARANTAACK